MPEFLTFIRMKMHEAATAGCIREHGTADFFNNRGALPLYGIFLFQATGTITVDLTSYAVSGYTVVFCTPFQMLHFDISTGDIRALWFHGDYYCIEYHKKEVACNGFLFNNIYSPPLVSLDRSGFEGMLQILDKLGMELENTDPYSIAVARSYLQLLLALGSKAKASDLTAAEEHKKRHPVLLFQSMLEQHYIRERTPAFYAAQLGMTPNTFSKQCKTYFLKSPSALIQERVVLEAKKLIHLTLKSMKEIAAALHFEDEHYFSRYFKKHTGLSPTAFRESVGISIVAHSSRE